VRHLSYIVGAHASKSRRPYEYIVGEILCDFVGNCLVRHQTLADQCDVLMVPRVAIGESRAFRNT
jgi:hypothetical protein